MKVLLIGGAGFIGSALCHRLLRDKDIDVFVVEPPGSDLSRLDNIKADIKIFEAYISDVSILETLIARHNIDTVIHLVSSLLPGSSFEDYRMEFEYVISPTVCLMRYCAANKVKFVFFSSGGTIYGNSTSLPFKESDAPSPISYYGFSKQLLESCLIFESRMSGLDYLIIRPSNPYGPGQSIRGKQGLIAVIIGKILSDEPIEVWGDGSCVRDYIYIDDMVDSVYQLIVNNVYNKIVNVGSGFGYSVNTVIKSLESVIGRGLDVVYKEGRQVDVNTMILDISVLKRYTVVKHTHFEDGLRRFFDYSNSNQ